MLPERGSPSLHWKRDVGPTMLLRRYPFPRVPSGVFSIQPMLASSSVLTKTYPKPGSEAVPPQFTPPMEPGKSTVEYGFAPSSRYKYGVNAPTLYKPPLRSASSRQNFACSSFVSAGVTMSSALYVLRASTGGLSGNGWVKELRSPGTLLIGTGRSSTPNTGLPVSRLRMYICACLGTATSAGIFSPLTVMSMRVAGEGRS